MDFQIVNEISSFWVTLVPPIFLGTISILLYLWVIGKENRELFMKRIINKGSNQYVIYKGIWVPKNQTIKEVFMHETLLKSGFGSLKPLMIVFLAVLFFFGINQILLNIFQPLLTYDPSRLLYSSGVDDYLIAEIWMWYPHLQSSNQLYAIIMDLTNDTRYTSGIFQYSVEAFIRFNIVCCIGIFLYTALKQKKLGWLSHKVLTRLTILIVILMIALAGILFSNIQRINNEARYRCYEAYSILEEKRDDLAELRRNTQKIKIENYLSVIKHERERYGQDFYYGAFGIRNRFNETIINAIREFYRFFSENSLVVQENHSPVYETENSNKDDMFIVDDEITTP